MAARRDKSAVETTEVPVGALIPQPHGGALRYGGTNRGGTGRPPSEIRQRLRGSFADRIKILEEIADKAEANQDRIRALDILAKYGLGTTKELTVEHVQDKLKATLAVISDSLPPDQAESIISKLEAVWR